MASSLGRGARPTLPTRTSRERPLPRTTASTRRTRHHRGPTTARSRASRQRRRLPVTASPTRQHRGPTPPWATPSRTSCRTSVATPAEPDAAKDEGSGSDLEREPASRGASPSAQRAITDARASITLRRSVCASCFRSCHDACRKCAVASGMMAQRPLLGVWMWSLFWNCASALRDVRSQG
jgi:hypothetical protein